MPESQNTIEVGLSWINETRNDLTVLFGDNQRVLVPAGGQSQHFKFPVENNTVFNMQFSLPDGTSVPCELQWRTVADKFAITQKNGDEPKEAVRLDPKRNELYQMNLSTPQDGGVLIVGTIDTK